VFVSFWIYQLRRIKIDLSKCVKTEGTLNELGFHQMEVCAMSSREFAVQLMNQVPDDKLDIVIAYVQELLARDDASDDAYCAKLYQNHLDDPDPDKEQTFTLDECKREWGLA
jgi:hypothetical protein